MAQTPQSTPEVTVALSNEELTRELVALKKQVTTLGQQNQALASRLSKLDRDLVALATRRGQAMHR